MVDITPGQKFYNDQIAYLEANDVDGLINNHYDKDAQLIGFDYVVKGHDALRNQFRDYLNFLGKLELKETEHFIETNDTIFFEATIATDQGDLRVYDAWVLKNGKILIHFTGVRS